MKHPQHILAVDAVPFIAKTGLVEGVNQIPSAEFFEALRSTLVVGCRELLDNQKVEQSDAIKAIETMATLSGLKVTVDASDFAPYSGDRTKLQLLPYCIFRLDHGSHDFEYFMYQRGKGTGESRLAGNDSFGYGGHMDLEDVLSKDSVIDAELTFSTALLRELREEVIIQDYKGRQLSEDERRELPMEYKGVLLDRSDDVGKLHLAVICVITLPLGHSVIPAEPALIPQGCFTLDEIIRNRNAESWTRLIAHAL